MVAGLPAAAQYSILTPAQHSALPLTSILAHFDFFGFLRIKAECLLFSSGFGFSLFFFPPLTFISREVHSIHWIKKKKLGSRNDERNLDAFEMRGFVSMVQSCVGSTAAAEREPHPAHCQT